MGLRSRYAADRRRVLARGVGDTVSTEYVIPDRIMRSTLPPVAKLVYAALLRSTANGDTTVQTGLRDLAAEIGVSQRTVSRALEALCRPGVVSRTWVRTARTGPDRWARYRLKCVRRFPRALG